MDTSVHNFAYRYRGVRTASLLPSTYGVDCRPPVINYGVPFRIIPTVLRSVRRREGKTKAGSRQRILTEFVGQQPCGIRVC